LCPVIRGVLKSNRANPAKREFRVGLLRGFMRILIVEDEPRMNELLRKGLYEHGFICMTTPDG